VASAPLDAAATRLVRKRGAHGAMPPGNRPRQSPASLDHLVQILSLDYLVEQQVTRVPDVPVDVSGVVTAGRLGRNKNEIHQDHERRGLAVVQTDGGPCPGLADNSVGKVLDTLLRNDLVICDLCRPRDYADPSAA
jgi:hypothetical protein